MDETLNIINKEDPSVRELLNKTAKELHAKYTKQRKIKEKYLNKQSPVKKVFNIIGDVVCVVLLLIGFVVCFSTINTTINGYMPNFAGYTNMVVSSKSMEASGYYVGDIVIVHSVDTKTLNVNDKIAFYVYSPSYAFVDTGTFTEISATNNQTKYTLTIPQLFGFQTDEVKKAEKANAEIVFHHIRAVYVDQNGELWFKTYGSSNGGDDSWWINEKYVVGIQDKSGVAKTVVGLVDLASKPYGILVLAAPAGVLIVALIFSFIRSVQIAKLELDCVEEKRKITDPICVKNGVGFQMDTKTKLKILAQATEENKEEYINLLWKKGKVPVGVKKYYMRKKLLLATNRDLLKLNRECEDMFEQGNKPKQIAKYYLTEKQKIEERGEQIKQRLKSIDKHKKELKKTKN